MFRAIFVFGWFGLSRDVSYGNGNESRVMFCAVGLLDGKLNEVVIKVFFLS